jgi:hypothetical protein
MQDSYWVILDEIWCIVPVLEAAHRTRLTADGGRRNLLLAQALTDRTFHWRPTRQSDRSQFFYVDFAVRAAVHVKRQPVPLPGSTYSGSR